VVLGGATALSASVVLTVRSRVRAPGTSFARSVCSVRNPQPTPGATVLKVILRIVGAIFIIGLLEAQEKLALSVGKPGSRSTRAG